MERITDKHLEAVVLRINNETASPTNTWVKVADGKHVSNIGNYHLDYAYGGVALHRICSIGGGVDDIFGGHYPKRELYNRMQAFLTGLQAASEVPRGTEKSK